ncbi:archaellin/type IV pilin N-terminal domain-containing protein [Methanoregula sp.]|uniref:archaellin/type IV pilin N-terminal domain-containing protein n=1 Tax=Methanoregula sp. TaxID=2052170 RepID=UPI002BCFF5CB|nr:archaellin/type IV pilin N-terminal domain-containing protein [Methanoregula sp.]HVP96168.1 archaellin/type IV pilin N-terminal domain-containing protein [Methanoregula sp.]
MSSSKQNDSGFTGLEAAIVLIAFVVVAAVFSYVVLGAGFFTTQKAQQTVHTSVEQSSSTLEIVGNVYGTGTGNGGSGSTITYVNFSMELAPGGTPIDFSKVVMVFSNSTTLQTLAAQSTAATVVTQPVAGGWAITSVQNSPSTTLSILLQPDEQFQISCQPTNPIPSNDVFTIEVRPSVGAAFSITRTAPAAIYAVNTLY